MVVITLRMAAFSTSALMAAQGGEAAAATPAPNTDTKAATNRMLRRGAMGIMVQLLPGLVRDDVGHGFGGNRAPIYLRALQSVRGCSFPRELAGVRSFRHASRATQTGGIRAGEVFR